MSENLFFEDPWNPKDEEIKQWAYSNANCPDQDFELTLIDGDKDILLLDIAMDKNCPGRDFFIYTLYLMVGDAVRTKNDVRKKQLISLIQQIDSSSDKIIKKWKQESLDLLKGNISFEYNYWCEPRSYQ